jgi:hypothetical protein
MHMAIDDSEVHRVGNGTFQISQVKRTVDMRCGWGEATNARSVEQVSLAIDGARLRELLGSKALPAPLERILSSTRAFAREGVIEVCAQHLHSVPERVARRASQSVPEDLEHVVLDCLAKNRRMRPERADQLARRLRECAVAGKWSEADAKAWWQRAGEARATAPDRAFDDIRRRELSCPTRRDLPACHRAACDERASEPRQAESFRLRSRYESGEDAELLLGFGR